MTQTNFVILAAGKGTRMRSNVPKVLHKIAGRSMLGHVVDAVDSLSSDAKKIIVTGHGAALVEEQFQSGDTVFVEQRDHQGLSNSQMLFYAGL